MSLPSLHGDGAKTQGHALYNRPLDAHAHRRKAGEKTWILPGGEQNIHLLYSEISVLFHRRKCCFSCSLVLFLDFVGDSDIIIFFTDKIKV